jgi:hypothetical protein
MPKATVSTENERHELKSCPGGFVELRQLSWAEMMKRRDIASRMYADVSTRQNVTQETIRQYMEVVNVAIMEFEFKTCIVDHNLEDDDGNLLDFSNPMSLSILNPKIGSEIDRYIEQMNQEDETSVVPLEKQLTSSLQDGETKPTDSTILSP